MWVLPVRLYTVVALSIRQGSEGEVNTFPVQGMLVDTLAKSVKPSNLRRSTRLTIAVPVTVSGVDALGSSFSESTRTITVNRHGGKLLLNHEVRVKDLVKLTSPRFNRTVNAVVVWLGKRRTEGEAREVAVELLEPGNIWGVGFPPADWDEASTMSNPAEGAGTPSPVPVAQATEAGAAELASAGFAGETGPANPAGGSAPVSNQLDETVRWPAAPLPLPAPPGEESPNAPGSNGNGKGSRNISSKCEGSDPAVSGLTESVNNLIQTSLANFEEELSRIIKIHTKAFEKRAFGTAMESVETARKEIQQATPGLVQESIAQLRGQVQKDMENFATLLEELKQRATNDAVSTLRSRVAAALKALDG